MVHFVSTWLTNRMAGWLLAMCVTATAIDSAVAGDSSDLAEKLGAVMAAESPCSLSYDADAIRVFIEKRVKADDMDFAHNLDLETWTVSNSISQMSPSSKVAFCTQETRVAKSFGFIK